MLILTRRIGEKLMIGDDISVTILGVKGNQVRLGVHAPENVAIHREEIYDKIQEEERAMTRKQDKMGMRNPLREVGGKGVQNSVSQKIEGK